MKNIIPFPNKYAQKRTKNITEKNILIDNTDYLVIKNFEFTCPHCETVGKIIQEKIIFKKIQFYCAGCGNSHLITNPAFGKK